MIIVWLRQDLRLADHPALSAAAQAGEILPVYVLEEDGPWLPGGASRWWLHHSLARLNESLDARACPLILRRGKAVEELPRLAAECGASAIYWNRRSEPHETAREADLTRRLAQAGIATRSFDGNLLFEPGTLRTKSGGLFQVFTPFWRAILAAPPPARPLPAPPVLTAPRTLPPSLPLDSLGLMPRLNWWTGMAEHWQPGENAAIQRLHEFLDESALAYQSARDIPSRPGTSRLSPHLTFGEISPRQIWRVTRGREPSDGAETFLKELAWREFSYHLLAAVPTLPERPLRPEFADFPWSDDEAALSAWSKGRTGYPIVDAGLRELWRTGWMHNRVRMIVASFLVKDLLLPWQAGERWFWDTLVDADLASNAASWQWVAGCGADAAPFFRVFNPTLQGEKFDPQGRYVRHWVPELADLPDRYIHCPWLAPPSALAQAGIRLGDAYPRPMVDHDGARKRALAAFERIKKGAGESEQLGLF